TICETDTKHIDCFEGTHIRVSTASWGRQDSITCPNGDMSYTNCHDPNSVNVVRNLCNNRGTCYLTANNDEFNDPCPGTYKYLQVTWTCRKNK
ncbi:hypothetical protein OS493_003463, partial [Desmophyllum pertusum]